MFTDYNSGVWGLQKLCEAIGVAAQLSLPFSAGKLVYGKVKTSNISATMQKSFIVLSPSV